MRILFFGRLGDRIGRETEVELPADVRNVADLRQLLARLKPEVGSEFLGKTLRACVDDAIVNDDHPVDERSEVAFFPPLSGG
jgi:molybdopterin synthase sulfur carrier subunit